MTLERKKELFSGKVSSGSRTYFFDVKESVDGVKYLVIIESREVSEGIRKRNRMMIFQDDLPAFNEGFSKAFEFMFGENESKAYNIKEIRQKYPKAYEKWTDNEDIHLKNEFNQGKKINELADIFQRKPGAIRSRLQKLGLV